MSFTEGKDLDNGHGISATVVSTFRHPELVAMVEEEKREENKTTRAARGQGYRGIEPQ